MDRSVQLHTSELAEHSHDADNGSKADQTKKIENRRGNEEITDGI